MQKYFYTKSDITTILDVSDSKAYSIIKQLNNELKDKGYMITRARVPASYFCKRFNIKVEEVK